MNEILDISRVQHGILQQWGKTFQPPQWLKSKISMKDRWVTCRRGFFCCYVMLLCWRGYDDVHI